MLDIIQKQNIYKVIQLFKCMGSEKLHNHLVNALYENPYKHLEFAYNSIISKTTEFEMYVNGQLFVKPDIYIRAQEGYYFYEVKSANNPNRLYKGEKQIDRMNLWTEQYMNDVYEDVKLALVMPTHKQKKLNGILNNLQVDYYKY